MSLSQWQSYDRGHQKVELVNYLFIMKVRIKNIVWSILLTFLSVSGFSQPDKILEKNIVFEQLPVELGLGQRTVNDIVQDSEGYLWIATWSGLIRYDGRVTNIYLVGDSENDLKSNKITSVRESKDGNLWVGTRARGLFLYDKLRDAFVSYQTLIPELLPFKNVWDIELDSDGKPWVATEKGLIKIEDSEISVFNTDNGLSFDFITSIYKDSEEQFWLTSEFGLNQFDPLKEEVIETYFFKVDDKDKLLHNYFYEATGVVYNGKERIFITSKKGLKELTDDGLINHYSDSKETAFNLFRSLVHVQSNRPLLLVGSEMGLNVFDVQQDKFSLFIGDFDNSNLSHNTVTELYFDRTGVLWVGTKKGINKFDTYDKGFKLFKNSLFDRGENIITGINGVSEQVLISTIGGGLFHFDLEKEEFQSIDIEVSSDNDFTDFIQKLFLDFNNNVYLGTAGNGIYKFPITEIVKSDFQIKSYENYNASQGFSDNYIMSFGNSDDGGVWVGTWSGGLNKLFQDGTFYQYENEILFDAPVVELMQSDDILWVGSRGNGLYRFRIKGNQLELLSRYATDSTLKLSSDFISVIYQDSKGRVWVGTENGLNLYDARCDCFTIFKKKDGLETNEAISMLEDDEGRLWISNWSGLSVITFDASEIKLLYHFDRSDRLQGEFFYNEVSYKSQDGILFVGGSNGFNEINPDKFETNPFEPTAIISSFKVFEEELKPSEEFNDRQVLDNRIQKTKKVELRHHENSIEIEFSALHFAHPSKNKFQYKLDGFDEHWHETSQARPIATYTNLPHNEYVFLLKASNNDGLWQSEPLRLAIIIDPPWWKTVWAYILFIIVFSLLLIGFRYLIIARTTYESNLKLAQVERENLEKTNKAKLKFFTNVSHEFRTPLTLILGPIENLLESHGDKQTKQQLNIVKRNASRLLRLINQLLDFRKVETGNLKLRVAKGNFVKFVKEVKLSFDVRAEELGINFSMVSSSNVIELFFDRDQFEKILFNLLSNSFKHTSKGGEVTIKIIEHAQTVDLVVIDNGSGIPKENFEKIFDRFYSNDDALEGTGIGLALVSSLARLHKAEINFDSVQDEKTVFKITILKGEDHFEKAELIEDFKDSENIDKYARDEFEVTDEVDDEKYEKEIQDLDKLLIVEDNKDVRSFIKSIFLKRYVILEAENGEEALALAIEEVPNLIISDVMMPIMDGITLCKKLKSNRKTSHIPVILLTARTSLIFETEGYESGADDYISKPFSSGLLKVRVNNLIESRKKLRNAFSEGSELKLEPSMVSYTSSDELFINSALESIEKNMSNSDYSVDDLGKDVGLSRMQLYRKLKAMLGLSANEFIRTIRLKRAAQLLKTSEYTIAEVTYMCGFVDLQYFRKCFKKQFKVNPSDFQYIEEELDKEDSL